MEELRDRMKKTLESTRGNLASLRTGRANPELLAKIQVSYYGTMVPIQQVANITVPEPQVLMVNVFDKAAVEEVTKAIMSSNLNLNPQTEGSIIRLRLPDLTEDRRKELVKVLKKLCEDGRVSIRNIRREFVDDIKAKEKSKDISEDESKKVQADIQKNTDEFIADIDKLSHEKESEIMTI